MLDVFMPNQDGVETIRELRREFPKVAIIAISGKSAADPMLAVARQLGAAAVLEKPFSPEQLLNAIGEVLPA